MSEPLGPPAHVTQGLLDRVAAGALDADYAAASRRRDRPGRRFGALGSAVLVVLGVMLAISALHTERSAEVTARGRTELVGQITATRARLDDLRRQQAALSAEVDSLQQALLTTTADGRGVSARVERLGVVTGARAVTGPGLQVVVDDAPHADDESERVYDKDLQRLVNALWESGAEAIAINGQRLTVLSAIREAGDAITVNYRPLNQPYTVQVVGDPGDMQARFVDTTHGQAWLDLVSTVGLRFDMTAEDSVTLPASTRLDLRFARVVPGKGNAS